MVSGKTGSAMGSVTVDDRSTLSCKRLSFHVVETLTFQARNVLSRVPYDRWQQLLAASPMAILALCECSGKDIVLFLADIDCVQVTCYRRPVRPYCTYLRRVSVT